MLEAGALPKQVAHSLNVPYNKVVEIKNAFFDTVLVRKDRVPDPDQGSFFTNFWRSDRA